MVSQIVKSCCCAKPIKGQHPTDIMCMVTCKLVRFQAFMIMQGFLLYSALPTPFSGTRTAGRAGS